MDLTPSRMPIDVLIVEDEPADAELTARALRESRIPHKLRVMDDGEKAMQFLRKQSPFQAAPTPNPILLDLHLPGMSGHRVLKAIKDDPTLRRIPVVILTHSTELADIREAYQQYANCYVTKPISSERLADVAQSIEQFWMGLAKLP